MPVKSPIQNAVRNPANSARAEHALARRLAPAMVGAGQGNIIVTGNTSALRGRPSFAGFAPTKAAQRILTEAIARELGPKGVQVSYIIIDAVIDVPWTRERFKDKPDQFFIKPVAIAEEAWHLTQQDRSAWGRSRIVLQDSQSADTGILP